MDNAEEKSLFRVRYLKLHTKKSVGSGLTEPTNKYAAFEQALELAKTCKVVTILYQDTGEHFAGNKGKWFLYRIIK